MARTGSVAAVAEATGWHQAAFRASAVPSLLIDRAGLVIDANEAYAEMSGRPLPQLIGSRSTTFIHAEDLPAVLAGLESIVAGAPRAVNQRRHQRGDGTWLDLTVATTPLDEADATGGVLLIEVLGHEPAGAVDADAEAWARHLLQAASDASSFHDAEGRIVLSTGTLGELLGLPVEDLRGRRLTDPALDARRTDDTPATAADDPVLRALDNREDTTATLGFAPPGGRRLWVSIKVSVVASSAMPAHASLRDVTDLVAAQQDARRLATQIEEQLTHQAEHDDLTGLKARRIALACIDDALAAGRPISAVFVDLDGFKAINDELGHLAGDDLLVGVARSLRALAGDLLVARAGGDEFLAVGADPAAADRFVTAVRQASDGPAGLAEGHGQVVRASAGMAHAEAGDTRSSLLARADAAMYEHKRRPR
jgi:diguanylate cyclase (GGDEF)-like protein/PAS domain S-box-containing protein